MAGLSNERVCCSKLRKATWHITILLCAVLAATFVGADPPPQVNSYTPDFELYMYASGGDIARMKAAILRGANVNAKVTSSEVTALMWAAAGDHLDAVAFLLQLHPDLELRDTGGNTALHYAAGQATYDMKEAKDFGNQIALQRGKERKTRIMQLLIDQGANVNAVNFYGFTPLQTLAGQGDISRLEMLVRYGAFIDYACKPDAATWFIHHPEDISKRVQYEALLHKAGQTALSIAVEARSIEDVRALLRLHADPNAKDWDGRTPLMLADDFETYKALIDAGANVNASDNQGRTPLIALCENMGVRTAHTRDDEYYPEALYMPDERCLALLFQKGAHVNVRWAGMTVLSMVQKVESECEEQRNRLIVQKYERMLLKAGAKR